MKNLGKFLLRIAAVVILLATGLTLFFTISTGEKRRGNGRQDETDYLITVGLVQGGENTPWKDANTASFEQTFTEENGYRMISTDCGNDQVKQIGAIQSMIAGGVDYILLSPVVETGWEDVLAEAEKAKIPVILVNNQIDEWETHAYECWIGSDYRNQMKKAGKWLEKYLEENPREPEQEADAKSDSEEGAGVGNADHSAEAQKSEGTEQDTAKAGVAEGTERDTAKAGVGEDAEQDTAKADGGEDVGNREEEEQDQGLTLVCLQGDIGSVEQMARAESWMLVLEKHPDWNMKGQQTGENRKDTGKEVMKLFLEQEPDLDVVIAEDDAMALGAIEAIHEAGKSCGPGGDIIIISFGGTKEGLQAVEDGYLNVTFEESPLLAPKTAETIQRLEAGIVVDREQYVKEKYYDSTMKLEKLIRKRAY